MIPEIPEILRLLAAGDINVAQAQGLVDQHLALAEQRSTVTVDIPALDRIANLIEKEQARA